MVGCLNPWGNRIERSEWGAEIICSLVVTCGWSWSWRSRWRTWRVNSLGDFGAVLKRTIGGTTRKTSWRTVIMYIHSYLHEWISWTSNGFLNVKFQNLEVGKFLKYDGISWFLDGLLIYGHYLKYYQSYIDYFIEFIEIRNFGAETDFSKFGFFRREMWIELSICW